MQHKKIVIIGGGPIGLTAALQFAQHGKHVTILDSDKPKGNDGRILALSYASSTFLNQLGAWQDSLATKINTVHISHNGFGISNIEASDVQLDNLGFTIKYSDICNLLREQINQYPKFIEMQKATVEKITSGKNHSIINYKNLNSSINVHSQITTDIAIIAEGGGIKLADIKYNNFDYQQLAIIAEFKPQMPHKNIAYERFDQYGPMVLLPYNENYILVWSLKKDFALNIINNNLLLEYLSNSFMKRFGDIKLIDSIHTFPLKLQIAKTRVLDRVILIGNSAQMVHPVSAQGMNLGLRDVQTLTNVLLDSNNDTILSKLYDYNKQRSNDVKIVTGFTHLLAKFLKSQSPMRNYLNSAGIFALSNTPFLQNKIANYLIFGI